MVYGALCTAAAWHSHRPLLYGVAIGAVPMLARIGIALYILSVQTQRCREAESCPGITQIGWFGLATEMAGTCSAVWFVYTCRRLIDLSLYDCRYGSSGGSGGTPPAL